MLAERVLSALPGGLRGAGLSLVTIALADLAILWSVEGVLVHTPGDAPQAGHLVAFVGGGLLASYESRRLIHAMSLATNGVLSGTLRSVLRSVDGLDLRGMEQLSVDRVHRHLTLEPPVVAAAGPPLAAAVRYSARGVAATLYLFTVSPPIAAVIALTLGMVGALRYVSGALAEEGIHAANALRHALLDTTQSIARGATQVLLHRPRGDALVARVRSLAFALADHNAEVELAALKSEAAASALLFGTISLLGVALGAVDAAVAGRVFLAVLFVLRSINQLVVHLGHVQRGAAAFANLSALEAEARACAARRVEATGAPPDPGFQRIGFKDLRFDYGSADFSFGPMDLTVRRGEILFIVGRNGSGKSTALKLLLGLYAPKEGSLTLDDAPAPTPAPQAWRDLFSVVLSDFVLFDRISGPEVPPERAAELLSWLELTDKVKIEGGRFSTLALSTGQRKRLAMVVALLQDRPVFVFDEWAADQDPEFREAYYRRILPDLKARGKTVICVTHDDQYFHLADRCVRIDGGRVVAP